MSANDAQRIETIYNISAFEFFGIGEFTTEAQSRRGEYFTTENTTRQKPQPKIRNISRKDAKAAKKIVIRTWRSSRLGGRNLRVRDVLCGHKICAWRANLEA
jgi:hypothetical protein